MGLHLDLGQPGIERILLDLRADVGLRLQLVDVLADVLQRLDVGVRREAVERLLNLDSRLRSCFFGEHLIALPLELLLLAPERAVASICLVLGGSFGGRRRGLVVALDGIGSLAEGALGRGKTSLAAGENGRVG